KRKVCSMTYTESGNMHITVSQDNNDHSYVLYPSQQMMVMFDRNVDVQSIVFGNKFHQTVIETNETKHILDYDCKVTKFINEIQVGDTKSTTTLSTYTYDKLENYKANYTGNKDLTGLLLGSYIESSMNSLNTLTLAKSLTEQYVDSSMFELPDYKILTASDYNKKLETDPKFLKEMNMEYGLVDQTEKVSKWKSFFDFLIDITPDIINVANDISRISKNNSTEASTPEVNNSNCALFQHRYELQRGFARNAYNSLNKKKKNDKIYGKFGDHTASTPKPELNVATLQSLRSTQRVMKGIRELAEKNGCSIPKAPEEFY
ncbi:MAG: hypothetical protein Q8910_11845, partial [Bacteroidota bacterium]|nr:hypothetical protein [Bacteroidota bacterium]